MLAAGGIAPRCWNCYRQQPQPLRRAAMAYAAAASARGLSAPPSLLGQTARTSLFTPDSSHSPSRLPLASLSPLGPSPGEDTPTGLRSTQLSRGPLSAESGGGGVPFGALSFFSAWQRQKATQAGPARTVTRATRRKKGGLQGGMSGMGEDEDDKAARHRRKWEAINDAIARVNDEFGKGTVAPLNTAGQVSDVEFFSTGILPLDLELQGGWPVGRIVEIYGHESSGKTTLALYAIAQMQKRGEPVLLIDAEHALDMQYARRLGVVTEGPERLLLVQPNSGEDAINVADKFIRTGAVSLVVVDSVSALVPQAELEGLVGEGALGSLARLMSQSMRKISGSAARAKCTVIFLNQIRNKIGVYGNPETTSGGMALKFHASVRCEMKVIERKKAGGEDLGIRVRVKVVKSKVSVPYREAEFDMAYGYGVQHEGAVLDAAEKLGIVSRKGAYYYYNDGVFQGREKMSAHLRQNPEVLEGLEGAVRDAIKAAAGGHAEDAQALPGGEGEEEEDEFGLLEEELEGATVDLEFEGGGGSR